MSFVTQPEQAGKQTRQVPCANCGKAFSLAPTGRPSRFCSGKCRTAAHRKQHQDNPPGLDLRRKPKTSELLNYCQIELGADSPVSALCEMMSDLSEKDFAFVKRWIKQATK